jgi:hypothetical protein
MPNPQNPNDDKTAPRRDDMRHRDDRETTEHDRADPSRKGTGPNNPLPGEPGGPSTSGFSPEERKAAEEGQRKDREAKDRDHDKGRDEHSKR